MGFWKKLFSRELSFEEEDDIENEEGVIEEELISIRDDVDFKKEEERSRYIMNCLEQIEEASKEIELLTGEYQLITAYLTDMEEVENLPEDQKKELFDTAMYLKNLEDERTTYLSKKERLTDSRFKQIEQQEAEIQEGLKKLQETEAYGKLVKQDLKRLDRERHSYEYRKTELVAIKSNAKGIATISVIALSLCLVMLAVMQFGFEMDTKLGYLLMAGLAAVAFTVLYVKNTEAIKEQVQVEKAINKLILLQNKVKIRYVNNTNLLEYYYLKYKVDNGKQLEKIWTMYQEEKEERKKFEQAQTDLDFFKNKLISFLKKSRVKYPERWIHQAAAIVDSKEMVEKRHELIVRRQSLRKQLDYNKELAVKAKEEVKEVVKSYPEYAKEITEMVDKYEAGIS